MIFTFGLLNVLFRMAMMFQNYQPSLYNQGTLTNKRVSFFRVFRDPLHGNWKDIPFMCVLLTRLFSLDTIILYPAVT